MELQLNERFADGPGHQLWGKFEHGTSLEMWNCLADHLSAINGIGDQLNDRVSLQLYHRLRKRLGKMRKENETIV